MQLGLKLSVVKIDVEPPIAELRYLGGAAVVLVVGFRVGQGEAGLAREARGHFLPCRAAAPQCVSARLAYCGVAP